MGVHQNRFVLSWNPHDILPQCYAAALVKALISAKG